MEAKPKSRQKVRRGRAAMERSAIPPLVAVRHGSHAGGILSRPTSYEPSTISTLNKIA